MSRELPPPGDYIAECTGPLIVVDTNEGALQIEVPCKLINSEISWQGRPRFTLGKKDGSLMEISITAFKDVFGWDGTDFMWLAFEDDMKTPRDFIGKQFELQNCKHDDSWIPKDKKEPVIQFKPSWLAPIGGGQKPAEMANAKKVKSQWGQKLRAINGGKKYTLPPVEQSKPLPPPAAKKADPSTMDECYAFCVEQNPGMDEAALANEVFYPALQGMFPSVDINKLKPTSLTKDQWGQLKAAFAK